MKTDELFGPEKLWLYFLLQALGAAFISFWPNFGFAWISFKPGDDIPHNYTLWEFPVPFGGDLLVTIAIQTFLTFLICSFLVSLDLKNGPWWFPGVTVIPMSGPSSDTSLLRKYYHMIRPYTQSELPEGGKGFLRGLGRAGAQIVLWEIILGIPLTILLCLAFLPTNVHFPAMSLTIGKGFFGFLLGFIQAPFFVYLVLGKFEDRGYENIE